MGSDMMYSQSEGDTETPREDSPIIFVITDTLKRVHPYPHEAHGLKATDWAASKQGSVGGGGQQRADWQDIVVKRNGDLNLRGRQKHPASRSILRLLCDCVLVRFKSSILMISNK